MITTFLISAQKRPELQGVLATIRGSMPRHRYRALCQHWRLFRRYCNAYKLSALPTTPQIVVRYVLALRKRGYRGKTIASMINVISRAHREAGYPSPTAHYLVRQPLRAFARNEKPLVMASMPLEEFRVTLDRIDACGPAFENARLRMAAIVAVAYWGMVSSVDVGALTMEHLTRERDRWVFNRVGYRRRQIILDRAKDPRYCPIARLERYLAAAKVTSGPLWHRIAMNGAFSHLTVHGRMVHSSVCVFFRSQADLKSYTFNSLRNGSLEAAFHAGVSYYELVTRGGFWDQRQLIIRLHQVVTLRPGDRALPHLGTKAPAYIPRMHKKRLNRRRDI